MIRFHIPGMKCGGCVRNVTTAVQRVDADAQVNVNLDSKEVGIATRAEAAAIAAAIKSAGYDAEYI